MGTEKNIYAKNLENANEKIFNMKKKNLHEIYTKHLKYPSKL